MGKSEVRNLRMCRSRHTILQDFPLNKQKSYKDQLCFPESCSSKAQQKTARSRAAHARVLPTYIPKPKYKINFLKGMKKSKVLSCVLYFNNTAFEKA